MRMNRIDLARTELEKQQILLNKTIRANRSGTRPREVAKLPALPISNRSRNFRVGSALLNEILNFEFQTFKLQTEIQKGNAKLKTDCTDHIYSVQVLMVQGVDALQCGEFTV